MGPMNCGKARRHVANYKGNICSISLKINLLSKMVLRTFAHLQRVCHVHRTVQILIIHNSRLPTLKCYGSLK